MEHGAGESSGCKFGVGTKVTARGGRTGAAEAGRRVVEEQVERVG